MNTGQDLKVEIPIIRPINIKRFDFNGQVVMSEFDTISATLTTTDENGIIHQETTPPTSLGRGGIVTHCLKFEMKSDLGEEMGVGVIFCMKSE